MINFSTLNLKKLRDIKLPSIRKLNEFKTYRYKSLSREDVLAFFANAKRAFSLNLTVKSGKVDTFICIDKDYTQQYYRESALPIVYATVYGGDTRDTDCCLFSPKHSLCYPFNMSCSKNIFDELASQLKGNECNIGIQFIFKKQDSNWKDTAKEQYDAYLNGLQNPSDLMLIRKLQIKVNDIASNYIRIEDNYELPAFQTKIKQTGYLWSFRIFISHTSKDKRNKALNKIKLVMSQMDGNNSFIPDAIANKKQFMEYMQFQQFPLVMNYHQILTPSEMMSLFSGDSVRDINEEKVIEPVNVLAKQKSDSDIDNLIELLPTVPRKSININEQEVFNTINKAFKKVGITNGKMNFAKLDTGASLHRAIFKLSDGIKLNKVTSETVNLEAELGYEGLHIEKGDSPGTAALTFMREERDVVYLRDIMNSQKYSETIKGMELPITIGEDATGNVLIFDLAKLVHVLIAGTTGSGKSVLLNAIIIMLMMCKSPDEVRFYLIDPKIVEFTPYKDSPHVEKIITEPEEANKLLFKLTDEMDRRYKLMSEYGHNDIIEFNEEYPELSLPRLVVITDEYADLYLQNKEVENPVTRLGSKSRGAGIHLIICTQRPKKEILSTNIQANLPTRFILALNKDSDYKTCLDGKVPKLLGNGDGVAQVEGIIDLIRFQAPAVSLKKKEVKSIIENINQYWKDGQYNNIELPNSVKQDDDLTRLKNVIFETGEVGVNKLQKMMEIKREKLQKLMEQLCEENWIRKNEGYNKGYSVIISREEMENLLDT